MTLWITLGVVGYVVGALIASRICLFRLQDSTGKMRWAGYTRHSPWGWPVVSGLFWPPVAVCLGVALLVLGVYKVVHPALRWWYTKPAVRKANRQKSLVSL